MNPVASIILTAVDKTKAAFASVKSGLSSLAAMASGLNAALGAVGIGISLIGFMSQIKKVIDAMDDARKSAQSAGTSVEKFSALTYAAGQSGVENLQGSLAKLAGSLQDARDGTGAAAEAFQKLRIDPAQFTDSSDALLAIADRFAKMPDGINKTALAADLFGQKLGPKLIPLLNQGSDGIRELMQEAAELGLVMDDKATAAAEKFNDRLDKIGKRSSGVGIQIANELLPSLNQYVDALDDVIERGSLLDKIAFFGLGHISEDTLNRITDAGERVQDYNAKIFELQQELLELRRVEQADSPNIRIWENRIKALEKTRAGLIEAEKNANAERAKNADKTSNDIIDGYEDEAKAFKKSTQDKINDAERLQGALLSAFSGALAEEERYTKEAKNLRAKASRSTDAPDQDSIRGDATIAALKLQRLKENGTSDEIRDQAEAVRELAGALDDKEYRTALNKQADKAEATAADKAAEAARMRAEGLAEEMRKNEARIAEFGKTLETLDKPVTLDVVSTAQTENSLAKLREAKGLIEFINANPANLSINATGGAGTADALRTAALQHGRRR